MQRAKRRLACSRASSVNAPTTSSSSRMRRRSRTASAGGDCVAVTRGSNNAMEPSEGKSKVRPHRRTARLNAMKFKRNAKIGKFQRPTYGSLQNAVVLAPFHTLKKCFQTKLVELYSKEKIKNLNKKVKIAKKPNVSFEYDVIELKSLNEEKDDKPTVSRKRRSRQIKAKKAQNRTSRSLSYCQCDKNSENNENDSQVKSTQETKMKQQLLKTNEIQSVEPLSFLHSPLVRSFDNQGIKKRKIDNPITMVMSLKNDYQTGNYSFYKSPENMPEATSSSASDLSSRRDSSEMFSDSFSCKEEHLQGSLALSMTSFDSFLEQCDKNKRYPSNVEGSSKYCLQYKVLEEEKEDGTDRFLPSKPKLGDSGHLIVNSETKNSDEGIIDFMDREPLSRGITNVDIPQNLHPLRRQSRTKAKKQVSENGSCRSYYLRSANSHRDSIRQLEAREEPLSSNSNKNAPRTSDSANRCIDFEFKRPNKSLQETTNVFPNKESRRDDRNLSFRTDDKFSKIVQLENKQPNCTLPSSPISNTLESYSQTEEMLHNSTANPKTLLGKKKSSTHNLNINNTGSSETEPNCEILHQYKPNISATEQEDTQVKESNKQEILTEQKAKAEKKDTEDVWKSNTILPLVEDRNIVESSGGQLLPNLEHINYRSHESSSRPLDRLIQQPDNKESSFIFGPANLATRLGESCEFSFGLNWVLSSDEENSNHGDHFF